MANLQENCLVISNLDDGLDVYSIPNMQLMKTDSHRNINDMILMSLSLPMVNLCLEGKKTMLEFMMFRVVNFCKHLSTARVS